MGYNINGVELETDAEGYLLEPDYSEEAVQVIAAAMRKLLHLAFGILKSGRPFDPDHLGKIQVHPSDSRGRNRLHPAAR